MATFQFSLAQVQVFLLVFMRVGAILFLLPLFDSKNVPLILKVGLSIALSVLLMPVLQVAPLPFEDRLIPFATGLAGEVLLGVVIGFAVKLTFAGVQLAGQVIGFQMGLAIGNVLDPISQTQNSFLAQFYNLMAMMIFLAIDAHHWFFRALVESFGIIAPFAFRFNGPLAEYLMKITGEMFFVAVKVGAPVIVVLLITSVALGLVARAVPQMNIFITAMPLKIILGILFVGFTLPYLAAFLVQTFGQLATNIVLLLQLMA
jgi:flagellar biosynthetic protein FliR